ncbi:MAG TPA: GMP synthase subunit A [Candidatus Thermoplasmatota archaeon]|nr:GMP synthase subunit A [Candidatus Thermoplasmatota archaeon]
MTLRVYVVDNGGQWTHREWRVLTYLGVDSKIVPNTTPYDDLQDLDGLVLSGGAPRVGLQDTLGRCGDFLDKAAYPVLGICAGEQFMASHYGGKVAPGKVPEFGKTELILDDPTGGTMLKGLPPKSIVWESHNDEVVVVPDEFRVTAHSANCAVQAMEHKHKPRYGLQFHPEVEHTEYGEQIFRNFLETCRR